MFYFRALRPTLCGFRGRCGPLRGACVFRLGRAPPKGFESVPKASPGTAAGGQESRPLFHIDPRRREQDSSPPGLGRAFFFGSPKPFLFGPVQKEMGSGSSRSENGFFLQTISFLRKRNGPHPKEKSWRRSGRTLLSPAPSNTVITGMPSFRALRPAALRLSGQDNTLSRAPPDLGTAPRRGADTPRKHHPVPPQAGSRAARFFTSFHGAGRRRVLPQSLAGPFSLAARNRFFLGPSKKKWVRETLAFRSSGWQ